MHADEQDVLDAPFGQQAADLEPRIADRIRVVNLQRVDLAPPGTAGRALRLAVAAAVRLVDRPLRAFSDGKPRFQPPRKSGRPSRATC